MSYRWIGPPAFLAGLAAAWVWTQAGRPNGLALAAWIALGLIASLGAARAATLVVGDATSPPPSMLLCSVACALGGTVVLLLPTGWLRLLGGAGLLLMLYLALGLLAGLIDLALRIEQRSMS